MTGVVHNRPATVIHSAETVETGPDHRVANSGPEDDKHSLTGETSSSTSAPVGWGLTMETSVSTELDSNRGLGLTAVTEITVELAGGCGKEELSHTKAVSRKVGLESLKHSRYL